MKNLFIALVILFAFSCSSNENKSAKEEYSQINPVDTNKAISVRDVMYIDDFDTCGVRVVIQNGGCDPCFIASLNTLIDDSYRDVIRGAPGASFSYFSDKWSFRFRINIAFDAKESLGIVKQNIINKICSK